jgi:hypothetical protein
MRMPGFVAEASLNKARAHYCDAGGPISAARPVVSPQQIVIPPGLRCWLDYQTCNNSCANLPIWRRSVCYSYCFAFYNRCLHPVVR